jgi:5-enolpyruvylshikimate-3-phosphate synthase
MAGAVAACAARGRSVIAGHRWVAVSYPAFFDDLRALSVT